MHTVVCTFGSLIFEAPSLLRAGTQSLERCRGRSASLDQVTCGKGNYGDYDMKIKTNVLKWRPATGIFFWPKGVEVEFPDGTVYDITGSRDASGNSIDYNVNGTGVRGSPCHQALVEAGLIH